LENDTNHKQRGASSPLYHDFGVKLLDARITSLYSMLKIEEKFSLVSDSGNYQLGGKK